MDFKKLRLLALSFLALDIFRKPAEKVTPESIQNAERREVSKAAAKRKPQPFRRPKNQRKKRRMK